MDFIEFLNEEKGNLTKEEEIKEFLDNFDSNSSNPLFKKNLLLNVKDIPIILNSGNLRNKIEDIFNNKSNNSIIEISSFLDKFRKDNNSLTSSSNSGDDVFSYYLLSGLLLSEIFYLYLPPKVPDWKNILDLPKLPKNPKDRFIHRFYFKILELERDLRKKFIFPNIFFIKSLDNEVLYKISDNIKTIINDTKKDNDLTLTQFMTMILNQDKDVIKMIINVAYEKENHEKENQKNNNQEQTYQIDKNLEEQFHAFIRKNNYFYFVLNRPINNGPSNCKKNSDEYQCSSPESCPFLGMWKGILDSIIKNYIIPLNTAASVKIYEKSTPFFISEFIDIENELGVGELHKYCGFKFHLW